MVSPLNLIGQRFNRLVVLKRHPKNTSAGKSRWIVQCDCGNQSLVSTGNLRYGLSTQCRECGDRIGGIKTRTHGLSGTPQHSRWMVAKRNDIKKLLDCDWEFRMQQALFEFFDSCVLCGSTEDLQVDHLLPLSRGYGLHYDNAALLCRSCNASKGDKYISDLPKEYRQKLLHASANFVDYWDTLYA